MSNYEQRDNSGTLFANDKRGDNAKAPNAKGRAMIGGVMYWVSAWTKEGAKGKFQSLAFERMENQEPRQSGSSKPQDDDVPDWLK